MSDMAGTSTPYELEADTYHASRQRAGNAGAPEASARELVAAHDQRGLSGVELGAHHGSLAYATWGLTRSVLNAGVRCGCGGSSAPCTRLVAWLSTCARIGAIGLAVTR